MATKKKNVSNVSDIQRTPLMFRSRMATDDVEFDGVVFKLSALPSSVLAYAYDRSSQSGEIELLFTIVKFGLVGVEGLTDENGNSVELSVTEMKIGGVSRQAVTNKFLDGLPFPVFGVLAPRILELSGLLEAEKTKLDFTSPSAETGG